MAKRKTKVCYVCKKKKDAGAFQKDRSQPDGLQSRCRRCRNLNLTKKELTGIHGNNLELSDFPAGPYKGETFRSVFERLLEIECEAKVLRSRKITLKKAAMDLLKSAEIDSYTVPDYGTMTLKKGRLHIQFDDNIEAPDCDE